MTPHIHVCPQCNREWEHASAECFLRYRSTCPECLEEPELAYYHDDEDDGREYGGYYEP